MQNLDFNKMTKVVSAFYDCSEITALGSILNWANGKTGLVSTLIDLEISMKGEENSLFLPLRNLYFEKLGVEPPALSVTVDNATPAEKARLVKALKAVK